MNERTRTNDTPLVYARHDVSQAWSLSWRTLLHSVPEPRQAEGTQVGPVRGAMHRQVRHELANQGAKLEAWQQGNAPKERQAHGC